jgi:adenine-specific DNA-methyltransferase
MSLSKTLNKAYNVTSAFVESIPKKERKKYGQFFTSQKTAEFMASLFTIDFSKPELRLLDAGAGTGLLTTALVERLRDCGYKGQIYAVCYENDPKVLPTLAENLENLKKSLDIKYEIRIDNYLTSQNFVCADFFKKEAEEFDMIIGNPPYLKIAKDAPEALAMPEVCYGAPNLYFLFWAMGINNLKDGEEMVYIIPRSWTSGAYFERFRKFLFRHCVITNIHIFGSRDKVFDGESVLQETMIIKVKKTKEKPQYVKMSSSETSDFVDIKYYDVDYSTIVAPNQFVFLVTSQEEAEILSRVNSQSNTLESDDLRMRTGLIVDFRTREVLRDNDEDGSFPLFYSHHIRN